MSFLQGFVTGFSRSADTAIKSYLESDNQLKNRLAEKRIARGETEEARFKKEFREYKRDIQSLSKRAGGTDNAQYILNKFGYDEGKRIINDLHTKSFESGISVPSLFKLSERVGPSVTVDQLARYYTTPVNLGTGKSMKGAGGGFTRMFGGEDYIQKAVLKDTQAAVGDLTKASLPDVPEVLAPIDDLENYEIGYSTNYKEEYNRLLGVSRQFLEKGNINKATRIKIQAEANYIAADSMQKKEYTVPQLDKLAKSYEDQFIAKHGIKGDYFINGNFKNAKESQSQYDEAVKLAGQFRQFSSEAIKLGIPSADIKFALTNAILKNRQVTIVEPKKPDGSTDPLGVPVIKLIPDSILFKSNPTGAQPNVTSGNIINPTTQTALANLDVNSMVSQVNQAKDNTARQQAIAIFRRRLKGNPSKLSEFNNLISR